MAEYKCVEIGTEETPYGSKRFRVDRVNQDGVITYEYNFWLARSSGTGRSRAYPLYTVSSSLSEESYWKMDAEMQVQLWNAVLELAGIKPKS